MKVLSQGSSFGMEMKGWQGEKTRSSNLLLLHHSFVQKPLEAVCQLLLCQVQALVQAFII